MPDSSFIIIPLITLLAFFIKGVTGFGTALIMVPILTVLVGIHHAVVVSSILDVLGGVILFIRNPVADSRQFWVPMALGMVAGSVIGGIILKIVPMHGFELIMGTVIIFLGLWFLAGRGGKDESTLPATPPQTATSVDVGVSTFSGFCGGLFGISGPPIVFYLGNRLAKTAFRSTLIAVFMCGGIARVMTYSVTGLVDFTTLSLSLISIPGLLLGLYCGNHLFFRIPEVWFSRLIGVVLIMSALRLMLW